MALRLAAERVAAPVAAWSGAGLPTWMRRALLALLAAFWFAGALASRAPLTAAGDVVFGMLFVRWLLGPRPVD